MACNSNTEIENDNESLKSSGNTSENCNDQKQLLSDSISATSRQNGEQAGCEDEQMSEQDASERRKSGMMDFKTNSASPSTLQRPAEELPRRNFQIPRKIKEKKGLFQNLSPESREFDELIKLLSSFYLEPNSRGTFTYTKARLIHNELLEKEFIEKKRELRQNGRSDAELEETYGFLLPDKDKVQTICEKGLFVGHSRVNTLGSPAKGVYLSRYSDLLQMNPFEPGTTGDIIVFKIMKGKLKTIYETGPKNIVDPTQKFDCHVSKNGSKVASLYSYRAFEHTQQYLFEFAFEELKSRPRHVYPYAVLSFQYRGRDTGPSLNRLNHPLIDSSRASRRRYTVWSGTLVNKGEELFQISVRSSNLPLLPFRLPDRLDINTAMNLDEMKKKLPALLSWDTFYGKREVLKYGMYCSLFEVVSRSKPGNHNLAGLLQKLERDKIVLVKPLLDKGFLFLISSTQMQISNERRNRMEKGLHALFIFQDPRLITRFSSTCAAPPPRDPADGVVLRRLEPFLPALHHALLRLRAHPPKDLSIAVERQATDYLSQLRDRSRGPPQPFRLPEYRQHLDERPGYPAGPRPRFSTDTLRSYLHAPSTYQLPTAKATSLLSGEGLVPRRRPPPPPSVSTTSTSSSAAAAAASSAVSPAPSPMGGAEDEHSPVSDWGSQERVAAPAATVSASGTTARAAQSNGGSQRASLRASLGLGGGGREGRGPQYERDKMEKLLQLIHMHKRTLQEERDDDDDSWAWDAVGLKRRLEDGSSGQASKYLRTGLLSNGEPGRASCSEEAGSDDSQSLSLSMVMDSIGICDTDLRERMGQSSSSSGGGGGSGGDPSVQETHRLLKLLMSMLNRAIVPGATGAAELAAETLERVSAEALGLGLDQVRSETSDLDLRARAKEDEPPPAQEYLEDQTACSMSSMDVCSPASPGEPMQLHQPPPSASSSSSQPPELWSHPDKAPLPVVPDPLSGPGAAAATSDPSTLCQSLDTIIQDEFQSLSSHIKHLMDSQAIMYAPPASAKRPDVNARALRPGACFSTFVSRHVKPPAIQSYMNTLRDRMGHVVSQPWTAQSKPHPNVPSASAYREHTGVPSTVASSAAQTFPFAPAPTYAPSGTVTVSPASTAAVPSSGLPPPGPISAAPPLVTAVHLSPITPPQATPSPAASIASEAAAPSSSLGPAAAAVTTPVSSFTPPPAKTADPAPRKKSSSSSSSRHHRTKESHKSHASERSAEGKSTSSSEGSSTPLTAAALAAHQQQQPQQTVTDACSSYAVAHPTDSKSAANSLISQIKPDIFLSLVQMVQKNTLKFYIHVSDEDAQNQLCTEIKDYLKSFGNVECNPQSFLENNNTLDKFLVIIQNEDIAMHVDKIPALVSLKKLPSVSFAGVDSLDDVKNRTYNELFVSGGLIVSDELILNPELMTLDKLQRLLKFLEEQSSIWQWKVHCKTQKKLKELSRLNTDTMNMLNLLTLYQKKHLVEFLPYHECDAPTRMAPDLECLTKLQASHTQHRHIIFLTALPGKRKHEMWPQFSNRGIVVASMQEVLEDFTGILSYTPDQMDQPAPTAPTAPTPAPPTAPPPSAAEKDSGANDECVQEEDMSLDSEDETTAVSAPDTATTTTTTTTTAVAAAATAAATAATAANSTNEQPPQEPSPMQPPPPPQVQDFQPPIPPLPEMPPVPEMPPLPDAVTAQGSPMSYGSSSSSKMDFPSSSSAFASSSSGPEPVADSLASSFGVNPHQSYLCPGPSQWSPFSGFSLPSQPSPVYTPYPHQSPTASHASQPPVPAEEPSSGDVTPAVPPPLPDSEANNMGVPPTQTTAPPMTQNSQDGSHETQGTAMEPALVSYPIKSAMEPALVSYPIKPSMEPIGLPSLPPEPTIPPPPPGLHLAYGYGWGGDMTATQQQYGHMGDMSLVGMDVGMAEPTDVTGAAESMWAVGDLSGLTPQTTLPLNMPMSVSATPPGTPYLHSGEAMGSPMAEKNGGLTPSSSVGPNSQYIRTPLSSGPESHQSPAGRGGLGPRTLLSPPGPGMGPQGRGGGGGPRHGNHMGPGGYNNRGGMSGPSDMGMRGGFRGRAAPPMPRAMSRPPAPMRGHMRGGPQSPWGAPVRGIPPAPHQLQDYYSDYGYN
ncbi:protein TASOR isoform X3 [Engraulis encrasicolus]|uniref:protein TASOR isoform X3 n=1 Tax=Engraulis encrasicolus TaxID=184585 RepID=UPI002FD6D6BA